MPLYGYNDDLDFGLIRHDVRASEYQFFWSKWASKWCIETLGYEPFVELSNDMDVTLVFRHAEDSTIFAIRFPESRDCKVLVSADELPFTKNFVDN